MRGAVLLSAFIALIPIVDGYPQTKQDSITNAAGELKGVVLDIDEHIPLQYATVLVLHRNKGVITNEKGRFALSISDLNKTDTVRFQYIGYKTRNITIGELDSSSVVYLKEDIINLSETLIFGNAPGAESIVKKVLMNKDSNYRRTTSRKQAFIRERNTYDIGNKLKLKKSSFSQLDEDLIKLAETATPEHSTSYTDFLGNLYFTNNDGDSLSLKIEAIRAVSLKEKDMAELEQLESVFEDLFNDTGEKEYWKVKSGIFGQKIDMEDNEEKSGADTLNNKRLYYFRKGVEQQLNYTLLEDKDQWEFLHKTGKYNFTLVGGTSVNGEDVYIIDFTPKRNGKYIGRVYISTTTYALIRADYEYAPEKTGRDIHLFGVGYTENYFSGSIYFEKNQDNYGLKYFSQKTGTFISFDRNVALLKKRESFLFDKKLNEIKVGVEFRVNSEESVEFLILDDTGISDNQFADVEQKESMEIIYVDQFDDKLWKGFSIIEPTEQMREYKKHDAGLAE
ncbi:MAG: carboxypeptidase-like regulatory domain-containing protein [Bacteroidales bacterium]|nr:carboxypeptidase-like regulatory domain-containing protein [Bacteroidales bacterium]